MARRASASRLVLCHLDWLFEAKEDEEDEAGASRESIPMDIIMLVFPLEVPTALTLFMVMPIDRSESWLTLCIFLRIRVVVGRCSRMLLFGCRFFCTLFLLFLFSHLFNPFNQLNIVLLTSIHPPNLLIFL